MLVRFCPECSQRHEDREAVSCERCGAALFKPRASRAREPQALKRARGVGRKSNMNSHQRRAKIAMLRKRDGGTCWICKAPMDFDSHVLDDPDEATIDHIVPLSKGGTNSLKNLKLAHRYCNSVRGDAKA